MALSYRDSHNRLQFDMRLSNITQRAHRGPVTVCISQEPYCGYQQVGTHDPEEGSDSGPWLLLSNTADRTQLKYYTSETWA